MLVLKAALIKCVCYSCRMVHNSWPSSPVLANFCLGRHEPISIVSIHHWGDCISFDSIFELSLRVVVASIKTALCSSRSSWLRVCSLVPTLSPISCHDLNVRGINFSIGFINVFTWLQPSQVNPFDVGCCFAVNILEVFVAGKCEHLRYFRSF